MSAPLVILLSSLFIAPGLAGEGASSGHFRFRYRIRPADLLISGEETNEREQQDRVALLKNLPRQVNDTLLFLHVAFQVALGESSLYLIIDIGGPLLTRLHTRMRSFFLRPVRAAHCEKPLFVTVSKIEKFHLQALLANALVSRFFGSSL